MYQTVKTVDLTNSTGYDLANAMSSDSVKYKIFVKSIPYNKRGAYWPFDNIYISKNDELYDALTKNGTVKDNYVSYYNTIKEHIDKQMPHRLSSDHIESILLYILPTTYTEYYQ